MENFIHEKYIEIESLKKDWIYWIQINILLENKAGNPKKKKTFKCTDCDFEANSQQG